MSLVPNARDVRLAGSLRGDCSRFSDHERTGHACALGVILDEHVVRDVVVVVPAAGKGREDDAMGESQVPHFDGLEQCRGRRHVAEMFGLLEFRRVVAEDREVGSCVESKEAKQVVYMRLRDIVLVARSQRQKSR